MPVSQNEYLWSGATPILLISPARFFVYKGPKIDYFLSTPLDYRLLFGQSSLPARSRDCLRDTNMSAVEVLLPSANSCLTCGS